MPSSDSASNSEVGASFTALTLMGQDVVGLGSTAVRLLFERLAGSDAAPQRVVLPPTLTVRGSGEIPGPAAR